MEGWAGRSAAWGVWALCMLMVTATAGLIAVNWDTANPGGIDARWHVLPAGLRYLLTPLVGLLIVIYRPGNAVGWILLLASVAASAWALVHQVAIYAEWTAPGSVPGAEWYAWAGNWLWILFLLTTPTLLFLLFPDGRLLSPRWRWAVWGTVATSLGAVAGYALRPGLLDDAPFTTNPAGLGGAHGAMTLIGYVGLFAAGGILIAAAVSLVLRYRRAGSIERLQIKWLALAAVITTLGNVVPILLWAGAGPGGEIERPSATGLRADFAPAIPGVAGTTVPIAVGVAVLRYRLYDIQWIINRTAVYAPLTAMIGGLIPPAVLSFGWLLRLLTGSDQRDATLILSALLVAAAVTHFRPHLQALADRHFGPRDPTQELVAFCQQVDAVLDVVEEERLVEAFLERTLRALDATSGAVRLRQRGRVRTVCQEGAVPRPAELVAPLVHRGTRLGTLALGPRRGGGSYTAAERATVERAAASVTRAILLDRLLTGEAAQGRAAAPERS